MQSGRRVCLLLGLAVLFLVWDVTAWVRDGQRIPDYWLAHAADLPCTPHGYSMVDVQVGSTRFQFRARQMRSPVRRGNDGYYSTNGVSLVGLMPDMAMCTCNNRALFDQNNLDASREVLTNLYLKYTDMYKSINTDLSARGQFENVYEYAFEGKYKLLDYRYGLKKVIISTQLSF
jgi:hypothetical protein